MADTPKRLSDTARAVLSLAVARDDHLVRLPSLPIAAARQVIRSLLNAGLVEEVAAPMADAAYAWRNGEDGAPLMLRATAAGLARVGERDEKQAAPTTETTIAADAALQSDAATGANAEEQKPTAAAQPAAVMPAGAAQDHQEAQARHDGRGRGSIGDTAPTAAQSASTPQALPTATLRRAAQALLDAWDDAANLGDDIIAALDGRFANLRAALATRISSVGSPRQPRDTKQSQVLAMLRSPEGATVAQIAEAMNWAPHTVRGFFAGLKKRQGIAVTAAERIRQVGPNKAGAKGSFTIYWIAE